MTAMLPGDRERLELLFAQAGAARRDDRLEDARSMYSEAVELCQEAGDGTWLARSLTGLGQIERDLGNFKNALAHYEEAVALYRNLDNPQRLAHTIRHVADIQIDAGSLGEAEPNYDEALAIYRTDDRTPPLDLANALRGFALLQERKGEREAAKRVWEEARDLYAAVNVEAGVEESSQRIAALAQ